MSEKLISVNDIPICNISQYEENQYWMAREPNTCQYTCAAQHIFNIDPNKRFKTEKKCREYIINQVKKVAKELK